MKGRLAIPIHAAGGVIVSYAGRALNHAAEYKLDSQAVTVAD